MAGTGTDGRVDGGRSRTRSMLLLLLAACVASAAVLIAQAGAAVPTGVTSLGVEGVGAAEMRQPGGVAVSPDGKHVFVADTGNNRVDEFTAEGSFVRAWGWGVRTGESQLETCTGETECSAGQAGKGAGQLNEPFGIAVGTGGVVYVENRAKGSGEIRKFSTTGKEVTAAGALPAGYGEDTSGKAGFSFPLPATNDIALGPNGQAYVADDAAGGSRVVIFPAGGGFSSIPVGSESITAIAYSSKAKRLYVALGYNHLRVYDAKGNFLEDIEASLGGEITALAADPRNGNVLVEPSVYGSPLSLTEITPEGKEERKIPVTEESEKIEQIHPFGLAVDPTVQFQNYEPGAIYVADRAASTVRVLAEPTPGEPTIDFVRAEGVSDGGANLSASVDPKGNDTHVYFEYGTTATYGSTVPAPPGADIGNGFESKPVSTHLYGLQPDTTYYYAVVAANPAGTQTLEGGSFSTFPVGGPLTLPDGRAYEQVTTEKGNRSIGGVFEPFASPVGGVAFGSAGPLPGSPSGTLNSGYVGLRGPEGWLTYGANPPVIDSLSASFLISPDLRQSVGYTEKDLGGNPPSGINLYLRDNLTGAETLVTPQYFSGFRNYRSYGVSADFSHIVFEAEARLTADTPEEEISSIYEFSNGTLKNIGILPGASAPSGSVTVFTNRAPHPVSESGSHVFFDDEPSPGAPKQVYVRIDGNRTVEVSASQAKKQDGEAGGQVASFVGASADGRFAFFTSSARLTDDAYTGAEGGKLTDRAPNLYRYDVTNGVLRDLTVARTGANAGLGAAVTGGVLPSSDGTSAYFVAQGELAAGATAGAQNLYRWTEAGGIRFVAKLIEGDYFTGEGSYESAPSSIARTTADGSVLAFTSRSPLDPRFPVVRETREIYRYSAAEGGIVCVSCSRSETSLQEAFLTEPSQLSSGYGGNVLSTDGSRLFFQTNAALVPQDTNGLRDVYEWENGAPHLITDGAAGGGTLIGPSADGNDVFFTTGDRLVPGDQDEYSDVYDARVGGGLPGPATTPGPCEAEGCRSAGSGTPANGSLGSRSFNGPPNKKAKHHRKKHRKHHRRHRHAKHRKHTRSHAHPASGKRG